MLAIILSVFFYSCSGALDAIMDTLKDHFSTSIFSKLNQRYWNPSVSWKNKYVNGDPTQGHVTFNFLGIKLPFPDALSDAWHTAKLLREGFNILAILSMFFVCFTYSWIYITLTFIALIVFRDGLFVLLYDKILRK
jgi:hypothetical protein